MKALLIRPPLLGGPGFPDIGLAYVAGMLEHHDIEIKILDMLLGYKTNDILLAIEKFKPAVIGITSHSHGHDKAYQITKAIKSHGNHLVVIGGPHVSVFGKAVLADGTADFAIKGEGEYTMLELCRAIGSNGDNYEEIKGLIWRSGSEIVENAGRPWIRDLDSLPFPAYEKFEMKKYWCYRESLLPMITSRGCPYGCNFCCVKLSMGRNFRPRSPKNVVDEVEHWYNQGWRKFEWVDDCFSLNIQRSMQICDLILERGLKITFKVCSIRLDLINEELLRKLKNSGCVELQYGIESGNQQILNIIRKSLTLEEVRRAVDLINREGISQYANFIIGHPGETYQTATQTVRFAESLPVGSLVFYNLVPYPGTELYEWVKKHARLLYSPREYLMVNSYDEDKPIFETKEFSAKERSKALRKGFRLHHRKLLSHRFGSFVGSFVYIFVRSNATWNLALKLFLDNRFGLTLLALLKKSRW